MSRLNSKNIEQNIGVVSVRSGKSLINVSRVGKSPNGTCTSFSQIVDAHSANVFQATDFDQGSSDSLCAVVNGITTELQRKSNAFGAIHYFATSAIAANQAGGVL